MTARVQFIPSNGKVAIRCGNKRFLASLEDATELLAELQVMYHERCINDNQKEETCSNKHQ